MNPENQVSNRELSKKLRDLGVPQESLFYYYDKPIFVNETGKQCGDLNQKCGVLAFENRIVENDCEIIAFDAGEADYTNAFLDKGEWYGRTFKGGRYSAFTVAESLDSFPEEFKKKLRITMCENGWRVDVDDIYDGPRVPSQEDINIANCVAKMRIYLIENNLIKL